MMLIPLMKKLKLFGHNVNKIKNMSILNDYKVQLLNRAPFGKQIFTVNTWLSAYLHDYYDSANELLNDIDEVLHGEIPRAGGQSRSLYLADININETKIYKDMEAWEENNNIIPDFVLPTADFKVIVEAWRDYLQG
jgi:hypothetical protein